MLRLSLEEALTRAESTNETLVIAGAGVDRARGVQLRARSEYFPQISGIAGYTRVFSSEFGDFGVGGDGAGGNGAPPPEPCGPFTPDTTLPLPERVDTLEQVVACQSREGRDILTAFRDLFGGSGGPFGRGNRYELGLSVDYPLYTGGRRRAQNRIAAAGLRSAEVEVLARQAQLTLNVTRAYFDAVLAARLVGIAEAALAQAERTLAVTRVAVEAGDQAEFDALRARVARDNQRSAVSQRSAEREIAYARLRTLIGLPIDQPLVLTTELDDEVPAAVAERAPEVEGPDTVAALRSSVRQAEEEVRIREEELRIARSQRLPELTLGGQLGWVGFPSSMLPSFNEFSRTASLSFFASIPIFTGGRIRGDILIAEAELLTARAQAELLRDLAAEDAYSTIAQLEAARAEYAATGATIVEATRAYEIAELRYREGVASLLELTDTRLMLEEARANRAVAARDLQVAQTRLALLPDLPLEGVTGVVPGGFPAGTVTPNLPEFLPRDGTVGGLRRPAATRRSGTGLPFPRNGTSAVPGQPGGGGAPGR